ncbi:MAG TPA: hypothetical protein VFR18_04805 [Terriglobia bacterium]|nr:hypothetical protein [Terriglobia bacterium]
MLATAIRDKKRTIVSDDEGLNNTSRAIELGTGLADPLKHIGSGT